MSMLGRTLKNLFSRPTTRMYPYKPSQAPAGNRGRVVWDIDRCIWCRRCEKNCPTSAIRTDPKNKTQKVTRVRCIACRTCVEVCPTSTITMQEEYSKSSTGIEVHVFKVGMKKWEYEVHHYDDSMHVDPDDLNEEN